MDKKQLTEISKFLSYVLRHNPTSIGLALEDGGWVRIDSLISSMKSRYPDMSEDILFEVVQSDNKQRYAVSGAKIRAQQGHSIDVGVVGSPRVPPENLFHGTTTENWAAIQRSGAILPMGRQHVHLSLDLTTAIQVASRRKTIKRAILEIKAGEMRRQGHVFVLSGNGVWLVESVPIEFASIVETENISK